MKKKYRPFHQLPYCCVPAALQWILYRRNLDVLDQETIGAELGLRIPERFKHLIINSRVIIKHDSCCEFGTQIEKKKYSINNFFKKFNIPLKISKKHFFRTDTEIIDFISSHLLREDEDIIIRFNNKTFKGNKKGDGHFALVAGYNKKNKKVLIGDPEPPFFKEVAIVEILKSISKEVDGVERGFHLIETSEKWKK